MGSGDRDGGGSRDAGQRPVNGQPATGPGAGPPQTKTLTAPPAPKGDPRALRAYASSLRELGATLRTVAALAAAPLPRTWRGAAPVAAEATASRLAGELRTAAGALEDMAAHLDRYAASLARAAAHHRSWLRRATEVAGVVLVTAAVVTVTVATVGAAAPVAAGLAIDAEAGAIGAGAEGAAGLAGGGAEGAATTAVAGMESAAASAAAAEVSLTGSLGARALPLLRQLAAYARPQLVGAEVTSGLDTAVRVGETGDLHPLGVGVELLENIVVGAGAGAASGRWLTRPGIAARLGRIISPTAPGDLKPVLVRHVSNAATNTGVCAIEDEAVGSQDSAYGAGLDFVQGLAGSGAGDLAAARDHRLTRGLNRVRNVRLPLLRLDHSGRLLSAELDDVYRVDPQAIRFSQNSMSKTGLRVTALSSGWQGAPIDVVVMPDGALTSLDNRRVLAARTLGIQANARLRDPSGVVPAELLGGRFSRYRLAPGATWLDVVTARIGSQRGWRGVHAYGRLAPPDRIKVGPYAIVGIRPPRKVTWLPGKAGWVGEVGVDSRTTAPFPGRSSSAPCPPGRLTAVCRSKRRVWDRGP